VDYVFACRENIHAPLLFNGTKEGLFWFKGGVNWLAVFLWLAGVSMSLAGLVAQYQPQASRLRGGKARRHSRTRRVQIGALRCLPTLVTSQVVP
jgi:hypothetical protein